jgi:hypothetical protein
MQMDWTTIEQASSLRDGSCASLQVHFRRNTTLQAIIISRYGTLPRLVTLGTAAFSMADRQSKGEAP